MRLGDDVDAQLHVRHQQHGASQAGSDDDHWRQSTQPVQQQSVAVPPSLVRVRGTSEGT